MKSNIPLFQVIHGRLLVATAVLSAILMLDILLPLNIYVDPLFIFCMFLIIKESRKTILLFSALTMLSILIMFVLEVKDYTHPSQFINRCISMVTIIATAILAIKYKKLQSEQIKSQEQRIRSLENIIFINSHKIRVPVTNIMGLSALLELPYNSQEDLSAIADGMKDSVKALDNFTKELASYVHDLKKTENEHPASSHDISTTEKEPNAFRIKGMFIVPQSTTGGIQYAGL